MYALLLALFSAICWGLAPAFGKIGLKGVHPVDGLAMRTLVTVVLVGGWFIISGGIGRISTTPSQGWFFLLIEAFLATFIGDLAYYTAIKWGEIGKTALVLAASPLITLFAGWLLLGETLSLLQLMGTVLILIGLILIGISSF